MNTIEENQSVTQPELAAEIIPPVTPQPKPSTTLYFKKVLASMGFYINRVQVPFEHLAQNTGVLKIDASDPAAPVLTAAAKANRGGIVAISEEEYEGLKKKLPFNPLAIKSRQPKLRILQTEPPRRPSPASAPVAAVEPISGRAGVGPVGGRGTGEGTGMPAPAPVPPALTEPSFKPAVGPKNYKTPVLKKTDSRSLSGGIPEPEPSEA